MGRNLKNYIKNSAITLTLLLIVSPVLAGEGKALFEKSCTGCHGTEVFTRDNRRVNSLEALEKQVKQCSLAAESKWADDNIGTVVEYLNKSFYKF